MGSVDYIWVKCCRKVLNKYNENKILNKSNLTGFSIYLLLNKFGSTNSHEYKDL